ncbi:MAG: hypothetical protein QM726_14210 [Chitinophagaceae bacterium]
MKFGYLGFCLLLLTFSYSTNAQQHKEQRFSASFTIGNALPVGAFGHKPTNSSTDSSGNTLLGIAGKLSIRYKIINGFGASFAVSNSVFVEDNDAIKDNIKKNLGDNYSVTVKTDAWRIYSAMVGAFYSFATGKKNKWFITPQLEAGVCKVIQPGYSYSYGPSDFNAGTGYYAGSATMPSRSLKTAFCYQATVNTEYNLPGNCFLLFNLSYYACRPEFLYPGNGSSNWNPTFSFTGGTVVIPPPITRSQTLSSIHFLTGAGIRF